MIDLLTTKPDYSLKIEDEKGFNGKELYLHIIERMPRVVFCGILSQKLNKRFEPEGFVSGILENGELSFKSTAIILFQDIDKTEYEFEIPSNDWSEVKGRCRIKDVFGEFERECICILTKQ